MISSRTIFFYIILCFALYIISPFFIIIILSIITAYAMHPFLENIRKIVKYKNISLFLLICWIFIPIYFLSILTYFECQNLASDFPKLQSAVSNAFIKINTYTPEFMINYNLQQYIQPATENFLVSAKLFLIEQIKIIAFGLPWFLFYFFLYGFTTYFILRDWDLFADKISKYIEMSSEYNKCIFNTTINGLKNSFNFLLFNYIFLAIVVGLLSYIVFSIVGLPYAILFSIVIAFITFIPNIGPWIFIALIGLLFGAFTNNTQGATIIIIYSLLGMIIFEYYIRPVFGGRAGNVYPLTTLFGLLGGYICLGAQGVLYGPIILIVAETFIKAHYKLKLKKNGR
ncbi:MAG: hypothetical protein B6U87_03265 [Candidatus Aenigmarchaeota archaeon ex4484_52]|nr:MAG: hypothetical protein B6U87_03265 [Candidatus Aenigmarchaeota archaeon ex4484_52]